MKRKKKTDHKYSKLNSEIPHQRETGRHAVAMEHKHPGAQAFQSTQPNLQYRRKSKSSSELGAQRLSRRFSHTRPRFGPNQSQGNRTGKGKSAQWRRMPDKGLRKNKFSVMGELFCFQTWQSRNQKVQFF